MLKSDFINLFHILALILINFGILIVCKLILKKKLLIVIYETYKTIVWCFFYRYDFPKFTLCWTEFVGVRVRVPCDTLSYVQANYGADWNKKVEHWNWKESPPNVRPNGQWESSEWPQVIKMF